MTTCWLSRGPSTTGVRTVRMVSGAGWLRATPEAMPSASSATAEITRDLAPGSVDLRRRGREPSFVVTPPPAEQPFDEPSPPAVDVPPPAAPEGEEGAAARISFRLTEHLKGRIEEAAAQAGLSVNAWLVRAASAPLDSRGRDRPAARRPPLGGQ